MPLLMKPCAEIGCPLRVPSGRRRCDACQRKRNAAYEATRPGTSKRGYSLASWRRLRLAVLMEENFCRHCANNGRTVAATDVDHINGHDGPESVAFWDRENLQALCHPCHSRKTAKEKGGRWKR